MIRIFSIVQNIVKSLFKVNIPLLSSETYNTIFAILIILISVVLMYNILYPEQVEAFEECTAKMAAEATALSNQNKLQIDDVKTRLEKIEKEIQDATSKATAYQEKTANIDTSELNTNELTDTMDIPSL